MLWYLKLEISIQIRYDNYDINESNDSWITTIMIWKAALDILPTKRKPFQRYVMATHEAPRTDLYPPYINDLYLSKYVFLIQFHDIAIL